MKQPRYRNSFKYFSSIIWLNNISCGYEHKSIEWDLHSFGQLNKCLEYKNSKCKLDVFDIFIVFKWAKTQKITFNWYEYWNQLKSLHVYKMWNFLNLLLILTQFTFFKNQPLLKSCFEFRFIISCISKQCLIFY